MIEEFKDGSYRYCLIEHALTPHLQLAKAQIQKIVGDDLLPRFSQGDDSATTLISVGYVLLASALADTRSRTEIVAITGFPEDFPEAIINVMDEYRLWDLDWFHVLHYVAQKEEPSPEEVMRAFNNATGGFYEVGWPLEYIVRFELARARVVIGGDRQNYIDEAFFEEFVRYRVSITSAIQP